MPRTFEDYDARVIKKPKGLLVGITGPQFSGKSYSALELATGMQEVYGREIYVVDSENDRALELAPYFKFRHVPFNQPKSPLEYYEVLKYVLAKDDCGVCIIDQCSHEHTAFLQMIEDYMQAKAGDDYEARERYKFVALVRPAAERKRFNELAAYGAIGRDGRKIPLILLYRGRDKTKPGKSKREGGDGKPVHMGWQSETTSDLPYFMTVRFLLPPGSEGHPNLTPDTEWEKLSVRTPIQFRNWFKPGFQLNREVGRRLAEWARGTEGSPAPDRAAILSEIKAVLKQHFPRDSRLTFTEAFGVSMEVAKDKMPAEQLLAGLQALKAKVPDATQLVPEIAPQEPAGASFSTTPDDTRSTAATIRQAAEAAGLSEERLRVICKGDPDEVPDSPEILEEILEKIRKETAS